MDHKHSKSPNELSYEHPGQSMSVEQPAEFPRQSMPMVIIIIIIISTFINSARVTQCHNGAESISADEHTGR